MAEATARRHFSKAAYFDKIKDYRVNHFYIPGQKKCPENVRAQKISPAKSIHIHQLVFRVLYTIADSVFLDFTGIQFKFPG